MEEAFNEETKDLVKAFHVYKNATYQQEKYNCWYTTPKYLIDNGLIINYDEIKDKHPKIKVVYVKEKEYKNFKNTLCWCSPHFRILNKKKLGIHTKPESQEHKMAKNWLYSIIKEGGEDLNLYYSSIKKPFKAVNPIKISELDINTNAYGFHEERGDELKKERRIEGIKNNRVDVYLPFNKTHKLLGNGIVFEIQFTKQHDNTELNRTLDRITKGFSVVWIKKKDFKKISNENIKLKENRLLIHSFSALLYYNNKQFGKKLISHVQEQSRLLDIKLLEIDKKKIKIENNLRRNNEIITERLTDFKKYIDLA